MSRSVGRVVGAVVGAVAAVVLGPAGWAAWALAAGGGLVGAAYGDYVARQSARIGDQGREPSSRTIRSSKEPAHYLLGRFANGGVLTWVEQDDGSPWTHLILALSEGPIEAVDDVLLDKKPISEFEGNVAQYELTVTPTEANAFMRNNADDWDEDVIGEGLSFLRVSLQFDPEQFPNGLPEIQVIGRGRNDIWDPRTDERGYTDNPALILLWWLTDGRANVPLDEINLQSFIDAANVCDEIVENPDGTQSKRYTMGALISDAELTPDVNDKILATCNGQLIRIGGILSLQVGAYYGPGDITLTEDMVIGAVSGAAEVDNANAINTLTGTFTNPDDWTETDFPPVRIDEWVLEDGAELAESMQIRYVLDPYQAQRLANMHLRKRRNGGAMSIPMNFNGYRFRPGRVVNVDLPSINMTGEFIVVDWTLGADDGCVVQLEAYDAAMFDDDVGRPYTPPGFISMPTGGIETPTNLAFLPSDDPMVKQGTVTWTPPPQPVQYYGITIRRDGEAVQTYQVPWSATSCDIQGLGPGQYVIEIYARGELGRSGTASVPINLTVPEPPVDLRLEVSNNVIVCRPLVNNPGFGTEFEMCINYLNDPDFIPFDQLTGLYGTFPGLTPETEYPIYARTISPLGKSEWFSQIARTANNPAEILPSIRDELDSVDLRLDDLDLSVEGLDGAITSVRQSLDNSDYRFQIESFERESADAALLSSVAKTSASREELRRRIEFDERLIDAVVTVDPDTGTIINRAFQFTDERFTEAQLEINGVDARITATVNDVQVLDGQLSDLSAEFQLIPGQITATAEAVVAEAISALEPAASFNFFDSAQGWVAVNGTIGTSTPNQIDVTWGDIENDGVSFNADENRLIRVTVERTSGAGWVGDVIIERDDSTTHTFAGIIDEVEAGGEIVRSIDFRGNENWHGTITSIRLVFGASSEDEFTIKQIVIGKPDAALLELEGLSARVTQAELDIDANTGQIAQRVTSTFYEANTVTFGNAETVVNGLDSVIELQATRQQLIDEDTIAKASQASIVIDGYDGTITSLAQTVEDNQEDNEQQFTSVEQQLDATNGRIRNQAFSISQNSQEIEGGLIEQLRSETAVALYRAGALERDANFAFAISELNIDVGPDGSLAQSMNRLEAVTQVQGQAIQSNVDSLQEARTDIEGNAAAISGVSLEVQNVQTELSATIDRVDQVEIDSGNNTTAISGVQAQVNDPVNNTSALFQTVQQAQTTADGAVSSVTDLTNRVEDNESDISAQGQLIINVQQDASNNAQAITNLGARVESNEQFASAQLILNAEYEDELGNLSARAALVTDVNNRITGVIIDDDGNERVIEFTADSARFVDGNGVLKIYYDLNNNRYVFDGEIIANSGFFGGTLAANSVRVGNIRQGVDFTSLVPNSALQTGDFDGWSSISSGLVISPKGSGAGAASQNQPFPYALVAPNNSLQYQATVAEFIPVEPGQQITSEFWVAGGGSPSSVWQLRVLFHDADGNAVGSTVIRQANVTSTTWVKITPDPYLVPAGASTIRTITVRRVSGGTGSSYLAGLVITRRDPDALAALASASSANQSIGLLADSLGGLATQDVVQVAELGETIIQGGFIRTELISADTFVGRVFRGSYFLMEEPGSDYFALQGAPAFGANNNLYRWFGQKTSTTWNSAANEPILSGMSMVNSRTHETVNGDAYFGGTFSAGTITIAEQNTQLSTNATIETGRYGSNGGQIQIAASFTQFAAWQDPGACPVGSIPQPGGVLYIERGNLTGTSWTVVAQVAITGSNQRNTIGGECSYVANAGATITFTDNQQISEDRRYRARIAATNIMRGSSSQGLGTQSVSIISTEE